MLFALDDAIEEREWGRVHSGVRIAVNALTTVLNSLQDVVMPVGQVRHIHVSDLRLSPLCLLTRVLSLVSHGL